jgi:hypothetical protein
MLANAHNALLSRTLGESPWYSVRRYHERANLDANERHVPPHARPLLSETSFVSGSVARGSDRLYQLPAIHEWGPVVVPRSARWRKAFALPTFVVLDARGRVVYRRIGIERELPRLATRVEPTAALSIVTASPPSLI